MIVYYNEVQYYASIDNFDVRVKYSDNILVNSADDGIFEYNNNTLISKTNSRFASTGDIFTYIS